MLDVADISDLSVYLILHHRITNILNQTDKFTRILSVIKESFNPPLLPQREQISTDILQFPAHPRELGFSIRPRRVCAHCSSLFLLSRSCKSLSGTGLQSRSLSALTFGANDSIACLFAFVRWRSHECHARHTGREEAVPRNFTR